MSALFRKILRKVFHVEEASCLHRADKRKRLGARDINKSSSSGSSTRRTTPALYQSIIAPRHPAQQSRLQAAAQPPLMPSASSVVVRTVLGSLACTDGFRVRTRDPDSNVHLRTLHSSSSIAAAAVQQAPCNTLNTAGSRTGLCCSSLSLALPHRADHARQDRERPRPL